MKRKILVSAFAAFCLLAALGLILYPGISNYVNQKYITEVHAEYMQQMEESDDADLLTIKQQAEAYNQTLVPGVSVSQDYSTESLLTAAQNYEELLDPLETGTMGYVEIPKISVQLPILHGTDSQTLERGVGHLLGSSLPIGGDSTHTILSGHSGMASQKMFTDLALLEIGDVFYLQVLKETLAYQVDDIQTVLPHDTTHLQIVPGGDYCTLITCTPIGVNTHRLLVRGHRIPYEEAVAVQEEIALTTTESGSDWERQYILGLLLGLLAITAVCAFFSVRRLIHSKMRHEGHFKGGRYLCGRH